MRILAIDDEADTRRLYQDLLGQAGHHVTPARDAVEATALLKIGAFDLILLDLMMPGIDGLQFAQSLANRWDTFEIPVLVVSCRDDAESRAWTKLQGCRGFLSKPFTPADLLDAIARVLHGLGGA
jgi:two-component system phosphate regulon response regulator OmpR